MQNAEEHLHFCSNLFCSWTGDHFSIFPNPNTGVEVKWNEIKQREFDVIARKISSRSLSLNCYIVPIMMMMIIHFCAKRSLRSSASQKQMFRVFVS